MRKRPLRYPEETDAVNQRVVSRAAEDAIFASLPASSSSLVFNGSSHPSVLYYCLLYVLHAASPGRISKKSHSGEKSCAKKRSSAKKAISYVSVYFYYVITLLILVNRVQ